MQVETLKLRPEDVRNPDPLMPQLQQLWADSKEIWDKNEADKDFMMFVAADYQLVYRALLKFQYRINTFLEWGSGTGVATIMANMLGFEAYGIEIESGLIDRARELSEKYKTRTVFAQGSFIPDSYDWNAMSADENFRTRADGPSGYDELDLELRDFDLIYAYPWPDEETLFQDIVRQCGNRKALLLTYHVREGIKLTRFDEGNKTSGGRGSRRAVDPS